MQEASTQLNQRNYPHPWDHAITLKPDAPDILDCKLYPLPPKDDEALRKWLKEEEEKGYIRPLISPIASTFFFLRKADGSQRPVQDYRGINRHTIRNRYPLLLIPELIAEVQDVFMFTKFDVEGGFNKVCIKDGDQHKAVFKQNMAYTNQWSCTLAFATLLRPSKT